MKLTGSYRSRARALTITYPLTPYEKSFSDRASMSAILAAMTSGASPCMTYASQAREISDFAASDSPPA